MIKCKVCNKKFKVITASHLKICCGLTPDEYRKKYPDSILVPKSIQQKKEQTLLKRYGVKIPYQSKEIREKGQKTVLKKYGVDHPMKSKEVKEKFKETCLNLYNYEYPMQSQKIRNKSIQTCLKRYNVKNPSNVEEIQNKKTRTCQTKYGVDFFFQSKQFRKKAIQTNLYKYQVEWSIENKEIRQKIKQTFLKKYGFDNPMKNPEIKKKSTQTYMDDYFRPKFNKLLKYLDLKLIDYKYKNSGVKHNWKCIKCDYEFEQTWNEIQQGYTCPKCYPRNQGHSKAEKEIIEYVKSLNINNIIENNRTTISPKELDIYIPDKQIAIEYNGLYYHSNQFNTPLNYHLNKTEECEKQGIHLIHIFEDEWVFKQDIVKARLKQILNVSDSERVHARKCIIQEIDPKTKNEFLEKYHIQGKDASVVKLGTFYNNKLVSVMTFGVGRISLGSKPKGNVWELQRFCSDFNYHIPGVASKLLEHFKRNYEWKEIFSYADRRWSKGNLYYKLGFELDHITQPNYWYIKNYKRIHRFNLRKKPNDPKDIPEWVLRQEEGYSRIWDCGSLKFVLSK